ncbi:DedA family protein [Clostridium fallax]|uniref:Membrane protein DedA, SNARE-associated domain n=1 Tax=Clostridium fallax TaxID=1533 RepID=A0A1M4Z745_9CLOT|nr:DedA family protein [Clostridium fallax]SHF13572.1 membrane protein DedA, SNARE-associated domain [Clostridium fallax]SQB05871.1 DedA family protein [Clostridium fallax]
MNLVTITKMFILKYGIISVFVTSLLEYLCIPIPSEIALPFIGAVAKSNHQNILLITIVSILGGSLGSLIMFLFGKYIGNNFLCKLKKNNPKFKLSIEKSEKILRKYRYIGVFLSRTFPFARTFTSIIAGIINMKLDRFLFFSALGMSLWNFILIKLGTIFTKNKKALNLVIKKYSTILIIIIIILIIIAIIRNKKLIKKTNKL